MKYTKKIYIVSLSVLIGILIIFNYRFFLRAENAGLPSGIYFPIPSITASENYGDDFLVYRSDLGFSFKYPRHLKVIVSDEGNLQLIITPRNPEDYDDLVPMIVISVAGNNRQMTPEEWLLSPNSGFDKSQKYFRSTIDNQEAVYTDRGMWTVVNTPGDKYRLSIAELSHENGATLFTEMGIIIESLKFYR